jgi:hypothetical protein
VSLLKDKAEIKTPMYRFDITVYQGNPLGSQAQGDVERISSPQVVTRMDQEAEIKVGQKVPIITERKLVGDVIHNTLIQQEVGFSLKIKPTDMRDGCLFVSLHADLSKVLPGASPNTTIYQQQLTTMRDLTLGKKVKVAFYPEKLDQQQAKSYSGHEVWMEITATEMKP